MREIKNGIKVIGTDLGYGNIKSSNIVLPTGIIQYTSEPVFQGNVLEYGNKYYRIGEGHKDFVIDKSLDDDFYLMNLAVMAKELQRVGLCNAKVFLATGLPLTWVRIQRNSFKNYLMKNKTVDFKLDGTKFHIEFTGCAVYPQGYPAIVNRLPELKGTNILADIGNGTMNILYIQDRKPVESKSWTEKLGVNQLVIRTKNAVMDMYGVKIDEGIIEEYIRHGKANISEKFSRVLHEEAVKYTEDIFAVLRKYEYNSELMRLYIIGGGGCIIKNFADYDTGSVEIISDICAAAKGYEYLAFEQLRRDK